jgi:hypothetical protein
VRRKQSAASAQAKALKSARQSARATESDRLLAAQFRFATDGWFDVSQGAVFTPLFEEHPTQKTAPPSSSTRQSTSLRATLFNVLPLTIWSTIYQDLNSILESKKRSEQADAEWRLNLREFPPRVRYSAFWRRWTAEISTCRSNCTSLNGMYNRAVLHTKQKLLR